jgi:hypothetical protein
MAEVEHNKESTMGAYAPVRAPRPPEGTGDEKVYHTRHPGSTFITQMGETVFFTGGGDLRTDRLDLQFELDKIADKHQGQAESATLRLCTS